MAVNGDSQGIEIWDSAHMASVPPQVFRRAMGQFATGVTVLSAASEAAVHSMTANAFMSVSLSPPLVVVAIAHTTRFRGALHDANASFGISVLSSEQLAECTHFGGKPQASMIAEYEWFHGAPVLKHSLAQFAVSVHSTLDAGDHRLVVAELKWLRTSQKKPLLFYAGKLGSHHWQEAQAATDAMNLDVWA